MEVTVYDSDELRELLRLAIKTIPKNTSDPQGIANILLSLAEMQYTWKMLEEDETQKSLVQMITGALRELNTQVSRG